MATRGTPRRSPKTERRPALNTLQAAEEREAFQTIIDVGPP